MQNLDAYREGVIELDELQEQKAKVSKRLHVLKDKQKDAQSALERPGQQKINYTELVRPFSSVPAGHEPG